MSAYDLDAMRRAMIEGQLRTTDVSDRRLIEALAAVARDRFVPPEMAALAYADTVLPLGGGRMLNRPMTTGRLLDEAGLKPTDRVLVIGAATGYAAAIASRLAARVFGLEEDGGLIAFARAALGEAAGIDIVEGPLAQGWSAGAPYDAIIMDGAGETIPEAIVEQLAEGGRLVGATIERGVSRLVSGRKQGGAFGLVAFAEAESVTLPGFAGAKEFVF